MDVCSPKDGFVFKLLVKNDDEVKIGTPLLQMDSEVEDRNTEHVQKMDSVREIRAAQYIGPQLVLLRALAKLAVDLATEKTRAAKQSYDLINREFHFGLLKVSDTYEPESTYIQSQLEQSRAEAQQKQLEYAVKRHTETNDLAKRLSDEHLAFLKRKKDRLSMTASTPGRVKNLRVGEGSFAELGSVLMEIQ